MGFVDRMDESLARLGRLLGWAEAPTTEQRNAGSNRRPLGAETRSTLREILHVEQAVYEALRRDFDAAEADAPEIHVVDHAAVTAPPE